MKYYLYVSESKVNMICAQIPQGLLRGLATELKVDLKLLSATVKRAASPETIYSKLDVVSTYIKQSGRLGTVDTPEFYIKDSLMMKSISYYGMAYYSGFSERTIVGLAGSTDHITGSKRSQPKEWAE